MISTTPRSRGSGWEARPAPDPGGGRATSAGCHRRYECALCRPPEFPERDRRSAGRRSLCRRTVRSAAGSLRERAPALPPELREDSEYLAPAGPQKEPLQGPPPEDNDGPRSEE